MADAVVDELKSRYPAKEIILFGHSWGGMLTSAYLNDATRKAKVKAWVNAAGVHNGTTLEQTTTDDINAEADARIQANENLSYWEDIKQQLSDDPSKGNSLAYSVVNEIPEVPVKVNITDFEFTDRAIDANIVMTPEVITTNFTSSLSDFNLPVLVLWGDYDFAVSKTLRQELLDNLGSQNVINNIFTQSGHYMMFHESTLFASSMKDFIEGL